ncbi:DHH family protein [Cyclospora cayetanensis]|uniref:DHH family protein n=1 Tax=Cyclospora cayetanensis TaxID=88456 RepID=A0A1D3D8Y4_9EIME|nr:DHH family protein [Cyclospora cayetanensis]
MPILISAIEKAHALLADKVESQPAKNLEADVAVILGNSSADLDSTVAAIGYAFALETCRLLQRGLSFDSSHQQQHEADLPAFLPLVDCSAADFRSRLQADWWISSCLGVPAASRLLFTTHSEVHQLLEQLQNPETSVRVCLVDHNDLGSGSREQWRQHVVSCVDHHVDKKALPAACKKRITGPCVGSCSSLVALLLEALQIHYSEILPPLPQDLAALLIGAIITDTVACRPDLSDLRWNAIDAHALAWLSGLLGWSYSLVLTAQQSFDVMRFDSRRLLEVGVTALLKSDYKCFSYAECSVAFSSLTISVQLLLAKEERRRQLFEAIIAEAAQGRQVYILLSLSPREGGSNQFDRQLALFAVAEESKRLERARAFLASCDNLRPEGDVKASPKRSLGEASTLSEAVVDPEGHVLGFCFFKVVHSCLSRKLLEPLVAFCFKGEPAVEVQHR